MSVDLEMLNESSTALKDELFQFHVELSRYEMSNQKFAAG